MKEKLLKLMAKKNERKTAIITQSEKTEDVTKLRALNTELDGLNKEIRSLQAMVKAPEDAIVNTTTLA